MWVSYDHLFVKFNHGYGEGIKISMQYQHVAQIPPIKHEYSQNYSM